MSASTPQATSPATEPPPPSAQAPEPVALPVETPVADPGPVASTEAVAPAEVTPPAVEAAPVEQVAPVQAAAPLEPVDHVEQTASAQVPTPVAPVFESAPVVTPVEPVAPVFETAPAVPAEPVAPVFETPPVVPAEPVAPVFETAPVVPVEPVAPVFETTPGAVSSPSVPMSPSEQNVSAKPSSSKGLVMGGVAAVVVVALGAYLMMGKSADAPVAKAPQAPAASAPTPTATAEALSAKDHLNQLLGLSRDSRWADVPAKISLVHSLAQVSATNDANSKTLTDQGYAQLNAEQVVLAAESFDKAIKADPGNSQARFGLGLALNRQRKFDAALAVLIDGLLIAPDSGKGWLTAAEVFAELGKTEASNSSLKLAYYLASNRETARKFLEDPKQVKSEKFRNIIESTLPALSGIPAKS